MKEKSIVAILLILAPLVLSISLSMDIYVPSLPSIIHYFHTSQQAVQWTLSIYMFGVGIGQLILGPITDTLGRRKVVLIGLLVYLVGTLVAMFSTSMGILILGRLLQSLGTCAALVVAYAVVRDLYDSQQSAKIYSFLNAATALAPITAPLLGGYLEVWFGTWRASFAFLFGFALLSLINTYFFLQETLPKENRVPFNFKELRQRYWRILGQQSFSRNAFLTATGLVVLFVFCCISSYLLITHLHLTEPQYGLAFATNALTFIIANLISTRLNRTKSLEFSIRLGILVLLCGATLMLLINLAFGLSVLNFLGPMWIMTLGAGILMGPTVALALEDFADVAGSASALMNASQFLLAGFFGTLLMLKNATSSLPFATMMLGLALLCTLWVFKVKASAAQQKT